MDENMKNKNKKLTTAQSKTDKYGFSNYDYDIINNRILEMFDNGEFKYDESAKKQTESHRNHKRSCKKFILENMNINGSKYFRSMLRSILSLSKEKNHIVEDKDPDVQEEIYELNNEISHLTVENKELIKLKYNCEQFHSKENMTALANSLVQEMNEKFKNDYVCNREDVKELNKTIERKTESVNYYKEKVSELENEVEYQREKVKDCIRESSDKAQNLADTLVKNETQSISVTIKKLNEELKESKAKLNQELKESKSKTKLNEELKELKSKAKLKDKEIEKLNNKDNNIGDDKEKKYKKMITDLKNKITELEVEQM